MLLGLPGCFLFLCLVLAYGSLRLIFPLSLYQDGAGEQKVKEMLHVQYSSSSLSPKATPRPLNPTWLQGGDGGSGGARRTWGWGRGVGIGRVGYWKNTVYRQRWAYMPVPDLR